VVRFAFFASVLPSANIYLGSTLQRALPNTPIPMMMRKSFPIPFSIPYIRRTTECNHVQRIEKKYAFGSCIIEPLFLLSSSGILFIVGGGNLSASAFRYRLDCVGFPF
jgi:hypothetical protein